MLNGLRWQFVKRVAGLDMPAQPTQTPLVSLQPTGTATVVDLTCHREHRLQWRNALFILSGCLFLTRTGVSLEVGKKGGEPCHCTDQRHIL